LRLFELVFAKIQQKSAENSQKHRIYEDFRIDPSPCAIVFLNHLKMSHSEECIYMAKIAEQAERYEGK
jgi:hypothetical protein